MNRFQSQNLKWKSTLFFFSFLFYSILYMLCFQFYANLSQASNSRLILIRLIISQLNIMIGISTSNAPKRWSKPYFLIDLLEMRARCWLNFGIKQSMIWEVVDIKRQKIHFLLIYIWNIIRIFNSCQPSMWGGENEKWSISKIQIDGLCLWFCVITL